MVLRVGDTIELALGPARILAITEGWVMVQRAGDRPLVFSVDGLKELIRSLAQLRARLEALEMRT